MGLEGQSGLRIQGFGSVAHVILPVSRSFHPSPFLSFWLISTLIILPLPLVGVLFPQRKPSACLVLHCSEP